MRIVVVFAHPSRESFNGAILETAMAALEAGGHEVRLIDLYREGFDPVLSAEDWADYTADTPRLVAKVAPHAEALAWAEGLIFIFPTWYYGPPAIFKGWMERVWLPGVTFDVAPGPRGRAVGRLRNVRRLTVITTSGSPWWWLRLIRDPGRSFLTRGMRVIFHPRVRIRWLQLHAINHSTKAQREAFLARVRQHLEAV